MRRIASITTLLFAITLMGLCSCNSEPEPDPTTALVYDETDIRRPDYDAVRARLSSNRDLWRATAPRAYRYDVTLRCFCGVLPSPARVTVRGGLITEATYVDSGHKTMPVPAEYLERYCQIETLFNTIGLACDARHERIQVQYDLEYGYPRNIRLDPIASAVDDEEEIQITGFQVLEPS